MSSDHAPDVFVYDDHRAHLSDWFSWKKSQNRRFSHRLFARLAGQRSPSLLLSVIQGRRNLTDVTATAFSEAMGLVGESRDFFFLLVRISRCEPGVERQRLEEEAAVRRRAHGSGVQEGAALLYQSCWYIPAIRELAVCDGFRADPEWIAGQLQPSVTVSEASSALRVLGRLGLLTIDASGVVSVHDEAVVTPGEERCLATLRCHRELSALAGDALGDFPSAERHFGGVTAAIPSSRVEELRAAMSAFQERVLSLCDGMASEADQVYQIGVHFFPLSGRITQ